MYNEKVLKDIKDQLIRNIILLCTVLLFFIAISILIANLVNNRLGMVIMVLGVCIDIFIWGIYGSSIFSYYRFIKELIIGRSREVKGIAKDISTYPVYKDNKLFYYEMIIEEDGVERVLLLDDQREWPQIITNRLYKFQVHENFIRDIMQIA